MGKSPTIEPPVNLTLNPGNAADRQGRKTTMGKEMMRDLEELQRVEDNFRRGEATRKEYRDVERTIIRKVSEPKKPAGSKR